jgi:hypothetical protein
VNAVVEEKSDPEVASILSPSEVRSRGPPQSSGAILSSGSLFSVEDATTIPKKVEMTGIPGCPPFLKSD